MVKVLGVFHSGLIPCAAGLRNAALLATKLTLATCCGANLKYDNNNVSDNLMKEIKIILHIEIAPTVYWF